MAEEMKACAYCGESIRANATKCRYCMSLLGDRASADQVERNAAAMITSITNGIDGHRRIQQAHTVAGVGVVTALVVATGAVAEKIPEILDRFRHFAVVTIVVAGILWFANQRADEIQIENQRALLRRCLAQMKRPEGDADALRARQAFRFRALGYIAVSLAFCIVIYFGAGRIMNLQAARENVAAVCECPIPALPPLPPCVCAPAVCPAPQVQVAPAPMNLKQGKP